MTKTCNWQMNQWYKPDCVQGRGEHFNIYETLSPRGWSPKLNFGSFHSSAIPQPRNYKPYSVCCKTFAKI